MLISNLEQNYFILHGRKSKMNHRENEENGEFECPKSESLVFQKVTQSCFDPSTIC